MPNSLTTFLKNAFKESAPIISGYVFTRGGDSITGVFDVVSDSAEAVFGGASSEINCSLLCDNVVIDGITIAKGQIWVYQSNDYRVIGIEKGDTATLIRFRGAHD